MIQTDALIIGAGPVGLFQAFQLGLQGVHAHLVDALPHVGGQCIELYPNKPIYDIPGIPRCTGVELVERLQTQTQPFKPDFHLGYEVSHLEAVADGQWLIKATLIDEAAHAASATEPSSQELQFLAKTVFIAAGVGAFQMRKLNLEGAATIERHSLHYRLPSGVLEHLQDSPTNVPTLSNSMAGQNIWVQGAEDSALEAALALSSLPEALRPAKVTLLHRRDVFQAEESLIDKMRQAVNAGQLHLQIGQITALHAQGSQLTRLDLATPEGQTQQVDADQLFAFLGVSPKLGPVAQWGLDMARKQLVVDPQDFSTSQAGIYAVGDVNTYPGKKKLILCGFHEATLATFGALARLHPERPALLQYTTTSSELKKRLGVD